MLLRTSNTKQQPIASHANKPELLAAQQGTFLWREINIGVLLNRSALLESIFKDWAPDGHLVCWA